MAFEDLRQFLDACEEIGELRMVEGADWDLEIGTLAELNFERNGPCLLFDNIKGYPLGYRGARTRPHGAARCALDSRARRRQRTGRWALLGVCH